MRKKVQRATWIFVIVALLGIANADPDSSTRPTTNNVSIGTAVN